jgi:hypothetical protein
VSDISPSSRTIFIIRHGEKPPDAPPPHGVDVEGNQTPTTDSHCLTPRGWQRAGALVSFFAPFDGHFRDGIATPRQLISPGYGDDTPDHRTYETILPLSLQLGTDIDNSYHEGDEATMGQTLAGQTTAGITLVCWEHKAIPTIATAIAPRSPIPTSWPDDRFDLVWSFAYDGQEYEFTQIPQMVLCNDSDSPIVEPQG